MTLQQDIAFYLWAMRCFGLCQATCGGRPAALMPLTRRQERHAFAAMLIMLTLVVLTLAYTVLNMEGFRSPVHSQIGNVYIMIDFVFSCAMMGLLSVYFYAKRRQHLRILHQLLALLGAEGDSREGNRWRRMPFVYVGLCVLIWIVHLRGFRHARVPGNGLVVHTCVFSFSFMVVGLVFAQYTWVRNVLAGALRRWNDELRQRLLAPNADDYYKTVRRILLQRVQLLRLCSEDINTFYGSIIFIVTSYILFSAPSGFFYLIAVVFTADFNGNYLRWLDGLIIGALWNFPWLVVIGIMFVSSDVTSEVQNTKRLLVKIPRRDCPCGVVKMVEKLLLKSLRQRAILNAYGFFAIDKAALFQLFTATLTYATILLQFKELESTSADRQQLAAGI